MEYNAYYLLLIAVSILLLGNRGAAQERLELSYTIQEETVTGYVIADVVAAAHLYQYYTDDVMQQLEYFFLSQNPQFVSYFNVDAQSGLLTVARPIDRDVLCAGMDECVADMDIAIRPVAFFRQIKVYVTITDINDNAPNFEENMVTVTIPENGIEGALFSLPGVADSDSGIRGIEGFQLEPNIPEFSLQVRENPDGPQDLHLQVNSRLDRETAAHYRLHVYAWDGGNPQKTGTLTIDVQVMDSNDNKPAFTNETYTVTVSENVPVGTTLIQVLATDSDEGQNGEVVYKFGRNTQQSYGYIFAIDKHTGDITTVSNLDRDSAHVYYLSVEATNEAANSLSDFAKVVVHVIDENDNAPHININSFSSSGQIEVPENSDNGTFVGQVLVSDPDVGANGQISCKILSALFGLVQPYDGEYQLVTSAVFDREITSEYDVMVECQDGGVPPQITRQSVEIHITDTNDNTPVFESTQYNITLTENNPLGEYLTTVKATDADIGVNAKMTYSIDYDEDMNPREDTGNMLTIDAHTGAVHAATSFDREQQSFYRFTLVATDNGTPALSASAVLTVLILDTNDEAPQFTESKYKFGTFENQPVGTEIGHVRATDRDNFPNNDVAYSFVAVHGVVNDFNIDSVTGLITTKKMLDRETVAEYHLRVATSNPGYQLSSTVNIVIYVADKNDNAPYIDFPSPGNDTVNITKSLSVGDTVTHILAHDLDLGQNGDLEYTLVQGNEKGYFDVNPILGEIFVSKLMEIDSGTLVYDLLLMVSDKGEPRLYSTAQLKVFISAAAVSAHTVTVAAGQKTNLIIVLVSCSFLACVIFVLFFLLILYVLRRRKQHQPDIRGRTNSSCMEATKALLTMKGSSSNAESGGVPEQESIDSGVDTGDCVRMENAGTGLEMVPWKAENQMTYGPAPPVFNYQQLQDGTSDRVISPVHQISEQRVLREIDLQFHDKPPSYDGKTCHLREIQLRVHEMLYHLNNVSRDTDSTNSDSGKGPSEEGDIAHHDSHDDTQDSPTGASSFPMVVFNPRSPTSPTNMQQPGFQVSPHDMTSPTSQVNKPSILKKSPISALSHGQFPSQATAIPDYCQRDRSSFNKKKTVHFVKPFSHTIPLPKTSNTNSALQKSSTQSSYSDIGSQARVNTVYSKPTHPNQLPYGHPQTASHLMHSNPLLPSPHMFLSHDDIDSMDMSEDGGSDSGSSTSGSYCMDNTTERFTGMNANNGAYSDHILV